MKSGSTTEQQIEKLFGKHTNRKTKDIQGYLCSTDISSTHCTNIKIYRRSKWRLLKLIGWLAKAAKRNGWLTRVTRRISRETKFHSVFTQIM